MFRWTSTHSGGGRLPTRDSGAKTSLLSRLLRYTRPTKWRMLATLSARTPLFRNVGSATPGSKPRRGYTRSTTRQCPRLRPPPRSAPQARTGCAPPDGPPKSRGEGAGRAEQNHHRPREPGQRALPPRGEPTVWEQQDHVDPEKPHGGTHVHWVSASSVTVSGTEPSLARA